jgi:hypothetical protein
VAGSAPRSAASSTADPRLSVDEIAARCRSVEPLGVSNITGHRDSAQ